MKSMNLSGDKLFDTFKQFVEGIIRKSVGVVDSDLLQMNISAISCGGDESFRNLEAFLDFLCSFRPLLETKKGKGKSHFEYILDEVEHNNKLAPCLLEVIRESFRTIRNSKGYSPHVDTKYKERTCWEVLHEVFYRGSTAFHLPKNEEEYDASQEVVNGLDSVLFFLKMGVNA